MNLDPKPAPAGFRVCVALLASYALISGGLTLIGWFAGLPRLTDWMGTGIAMFANAAFAAVCCGAALILASSYWPWRQPVVRILGLLVFLVGGTTLFQHVSGFNLGLDDILVHAPWGSRAAMSPGRIGPPASTSFTLLGLGLVLMTAGRRMRRMVPWLGIGVCIIAALGLMGYVLGADRLFGVAKFTGIAMQTGSVLLALALALVMCVPEYEPMRTLRQPSTAGLLARQSLPFIIGLPLLLGWLRIRLQAAGWIDTPMGVALLTLALIVLLCALLCWWVRSVARAEEELRNSEVRFRTLFEASLYGVITIDETGMVQSANPAAERLFGYRQDEIVGRNISMLMPQPFRSEHPSYLDNYRRTGLRKIIGIGREVIGLRKDGSQFPMDLAVSEFHLGERRYFLGGINDITERKRAEQSLLESEARERAARSEAEQASRLKDEFFANLSHELRNPLNAILGWVRLIERNPTDPKSISEGIQVISRNAKLQADLIADLLDISRIISGKLRLHVEDVHLSDVIMAAVDSVRHAAEAKHISIQPLVDDVPDVIRGDPGRLQQVIWNLLSNAIKFTPRGGSVRVFLARKGHHAEIAVSDTGVGMTQDFLRHAFERFRQADASTARQSGGLGLGLSIVKHLVELHGGVVQAASDGEGHGATFTVRLPVDPTQPLAEASLTPEEREKPVSKAGCDDFDLTDVKVLTIDDQKDARELLRRVLEECHAQVISASTTDEALHALMVHRPHIVLCDIGLPSKDGYEFIREMRKRGDQTPALAVTAFARSEDRLRALHAGYHGHVSKPIEPAELLARMGELVKGRVGGEARP